MVQSSILVTIFLLDKKNTAAHMRHLMEVVIKVNARHAMLSGPIVSKTGMKIPSTFHCELASSEAFGIG